MTLLFSPGHQDIDNAGDLDTVGGLKPTLELLQHEESKVRQSALWVIGSTVQHNTKTQVYDSATLIGSRCKRAADPGGRLLMCLSAISNAQACSARRSPGGGTPSLCTSPP